MDWPYSLPLRAFACDSIASFHVRRSQAPVHPKDSQFHFSILNPALPVHFCAIETDSSHSTRKRALPRWAWILVFVGFWTLVGLAFAGQLYLTQIKVGAAVSWQFALSRSLADWYTFAVLSLPAIALARKFPLGSAPAHLLVTLHLVASAVFSLVWMLVRAGLASGFEGKPFADTLRYALVATLVFNVLVYWVIIVATHAVGFYQQSRERERRELDLERRLTDARLRALQMQLNPHFLFNALHGVSALMYRDVDAADTMLVRLSELLREALHRSEAPEVSLRSELAFLDKYLSIEQIRFAGRLTVIREITEAALDSPVPNLILQPLVENAIKHGIEPQVRPGVIMLRARLMPSNRLHLEVEDNGRGLDATKAPDSGIGLANCRSRLQQLYGGQASLDLRAGADGGLCVVIELPVAVPASERTAAVSQTSRAAELG
ncbi:MAG TPA: histidine kinase [Verrucomicrobiota bacterium]|nr:histidine kinase [Verrucomicrobiota bacterium]